MPFMCHKSPFVRVALTLFLRWAGTNVKEMLSDGGFQRLVCVAGRLDVTAFVIDNLMKFK